MQNISGWIGQLSLRSVITEWNSASQRFSAILETLKLLESEYLNRTSQNQALKQSQGFDTSQKSVQTHLKKTKQPETPSWKPNFT